MEKIKSIFKSRRFWFATAGVVAIVAKHLGMEISEEELQNVVLIIVSWIFADGIRETK